MKLATAAQMRELDRRAIEERGISSIDLMDRAAQGVADAALELLPMRPAKCRAAVFCGAGNNGGDGIAAARLLFLRGVCVRVFLAGDYEKLTPDAMEETRRLSECGIELEAYQPENAGQQSFIRSCHVLIDALFGVGLSREIREDSVYAAAIRTMNECRAPVVAADIPSGVDADSGRVMGLAVQADKTITFTMMKVGHAVGDGALLSGDVTVRDIGIPVELARETLCPAQTVEADFLRAVLPKRKPDGHKGTFGKLLIVGGCVGYTGAPYLSAMAACRSGCGMVYLGVPETVWAVEAVKCTEAMPFPLADKNGMLSYKALQQIEEKLAICGALAIGPGLGRSAGVDRTVWALLRSTQKPVILDADGINALQGHMDILDARRGRVTILTPHDGEFARLGGDLSCGRVEAARRFAAAHGCILVLKGHKTIVAGSEGNVLVNTTGNSGMAKGGSGDVLTGLIASLLVQGVPSIQAAAAGVWIHGRAGDLSAEEKTPYAMTPLDTVQALPAVFRELCCNQ